MKMFQTRMAESRTLTDTSAADGTAIGDYHANFEISLIVGACVFPSYTFDIKEQLL